MSVGVGGGVICECDCDGSVRLLFVEEVRDVLLLGARDVFLLI